MAAVERTLTINVRKQVMMVPAYRRAKKAVTAIRQHLQKHMKSDNVKLGKYLNLKLWEHGIKNPALRITVVAKKDDKGIVTAELPSIPVKKHDLLKKKVNQETNQKTKEEASKETPKDEKGKAETATALPQTIPAALATQDATAAKKA